MKSHLAFSQLLLFAAAACLADSPKPNRDPQNAATDKGTSVAAYKDVANRIIDASLKKNDAWKKMEELCDGIGHRLSGSKSLDQAIAWALDTLKADGQENVRGEKVMIPRWVRGNESAKMIAPREFDLHMVGLGMSVGTPPEGITASVVCACDEEEFETHCKDATGKIVLFNNPMQVYDPAHGSGYGSAVRFRGKGPSMASSAGAVACLVRSVTAHSLRSPHTGATRYEEGVRPIPAAAISTEDADFIHRLLKKGEDVKVHLKMDARNEGLVESANVVAELVGREKPEEVLVIGGHIDSWDVGTGAHDDAGGCVIAMEAINVLRKLDLRPRRTIRVVLWTNEENGLAGGKKYAADHAAELKNHVGAIEADSGVFSPRGLGVDHKDDPTMKRASEQLRDILSLLKTLNATHVAEGWGGADIGPMKQSGVVLMGFEVEGSKYFNYHHSHADTLDKIDPRELSECVAAMAVVSYVIADMPGRLGE
ncbi:MAG TPA: M20/M25/M40 family metallo-hydrolase [Phycisphaerae bacterium]|nr:M20/M25/M40 family metallo-hydrolase [Phycisphaerae bacterium]